MAGKKLWDKNKLLVNEKKTDTVHVLPFITKKTGQFSQKKTHRSQTHETMSNSTNAQGNAVRTTHLLMG